MSCFPWALVCRGADIFAICVILTGRHSVSDPRVIWRSSGTFNFHQSFCSGNQSWAWTCYQKEIVNYLDEFLCTLYTWNNVGRNKEPDEKTKNIPLRIIIGKSVLRAKWREFWWCSYCVMNQNQIEHFFIARGTIFKDTGVGYRGLIPGPFHLFVPSSSFWV